MSTEEWFPESWQIVKRLLSAGPPLLEQLGQIIAGSSERAFDATHAVYMFTRLVEAMSSDDYEDMGWCLSQAVKYAMTAGASLDTLPELSRSGVGSPPAGPYHRRSR